MYDYNCPDCNEAKLQSDKNARKINEVIDQLNALIQVNNDTVDFIEAKANEVVEEIAEIKVHEVLDDLNTELVNIIPTYTKQKNEMSQLFQKDGFTSVITGDSISYNRYDFIPTGVTNGYECYSGMQSWAYLLKDTIHRNDVYFKHGDELDDLNIINGICDTSLEPYSNAMPFTNKYLKFSTQNNNASLSFKVRHTNSVTNKIVLYLAYNPNATACSFDVYVGNDKACSVNTKNTSNEYQGRGILCANVTCYPYNVREISLRNFAQSAPIPEASGLMEVEILGVGTKYSPVYITGQGSTTSKWLLDNIEERILKYNPNFVCIVTGTNDVFLGVTVDEYKLNLDTICSQIKTKNPKAEILLVGCGSYRSVDGQNWDNSQYKQDRTVMPYVQACKEIAFKYECYCISMMELFKNVPIADYRADNCHLNKFGNTMLLRSIVNMIMPKGLYDYKYLSSYKHENGFENKNLQSNYIKIKYNNNTAKYDVLKGEALVQNIQISSSGYRLIITLKNDYNTVVNPPRNVVQCAQTNTFLNVAYFNNYANIFEIVIRKADGSFIGPSDHNSADCEFMIML